MSHPIKTVCTCSRTATFVIHHYLVFKIIPPYGYTDPDIVLCNKSGKPSLHYRELQAKKYKALYKRAYNNFIERKYPYAYLEDSSEKYSINALYKFLVECFYEKPSKVPDSLARYIL